MVVKSTVIVPRNNYDGALPNIALHDGVDQIGDMPHAACGISWRMFAICEVWDDPRYLRQGASFRVFIKLIECNQVRHEIGAMLELAKSWKRIPQAMLLGIRLLVVILPSHM